MRCYEVTKKPIFPKDCESCYAKLSCEIYRAYQKLKKQYLDLNDKYFAVLGLHENVSNLKRNE